MALTRDEVLHVAQLARLSLEPAEIDLFTRQLNDILAYVEKLQELDTAGVPPLCRRHLHNLKPSCWRPSHIRIVSALSSTSGEMFTATVSSPLHSTSSNPTSRAI